ncbi:MAG TPA: lamin tail domain-containing protein [Blastocatellia bacterium]|jgi:predicted extracellular nuclease|nr:lamin tail domain-containing protein [Blastocatellia bacterium]
MTRQPVLWAFALILTVLIFLPPVARGVSATIVISEFRTRGPNGGNDEFIELYNLSASPVDISGWQVRGSNNSGTVSTRAVITAGTVLNGGCHYLLTNPNASGGPYSGAVAGNQTFSPGITDDGGIAVAAPDGTIVDQVGMSSGSAFKEGSALAPLNSNTSTSYERRPGGGSGSGQDTDNNGADFTPRTPSDPQSAASACLTGGVPTNPSGAGSAAPSSVAAGGNVLLVVQVTPGTNPASTGLAVTGNLAAIGGPAAQPFFDDGTNGDAAAGDNRFSFLATVAAGTDPGTKSIATTITDAQTRTGAASISLTVPGEAAGVAIHDIQGSAHLSPLAGSPVSNISGIVTARRSNGFYMQDPAPDSNPLTSEGIFVFTSSAPTVAVGDLVRVGGTVSEFRPGGTATNLTITQIGAPTVSVISSGNALPAATVIGAGGRVPPSSIIEDDAGGDVEAGGLFDPATDGVDFYESLESMLVQVNAPVASGPRTSQGEITVLADDGAGAGVRSGRGGIVVTAADFNPERIIVDNAITPTPQVNVGDHFTAPVVGVMDYGFGNFKVQATRPLTAAPGGLAPEATASASAGQVAIATFNVENLDPGDPAGKFSSLASLIVGNLKSPDIIAVEEIQDDNGAINNGVVDAAATYATLIAAIQTAGGPAYQFRSINPVNNQDGGEPGGNIRTGFLFRTDRGLSFNDRPGGDATTAVSVVSTAAGPQLSFSPGRIAPSNPAFNNSRKPLAGEFSFAGQRLFVIANHFNSKGGDQPLFGRFQPPARASETQRNQQAQAVNDFVDAILSADPQANIVVLGDFNDFEFSTAIGTLKGGVLHDLIETLPQSERYTYVFEGNSQALDHILVSSALFARPFEYDVVHVNSEFATQASDHDPQVVRLGTGPDFALAVNPSSITAQRGTTVNVQVAVNRAGGFAGAVTITAPGASSLKINVKPQSKTTSSGSASFKLKIKNNAPTGSQNVAFIGKDGAGRERSATLTLVIQ